MYKKQEEQLDSIIHDTIGSIENSNKEIQDISQFAKKEFASLEEEFEHLRAEASSIIEKVESIESHYKISRSKLLIVSKNSASYTDDEMKEIYNQTDQLRIDLAVEKEREAHLIQRRNELETHLYSIRKIAEKADQISNNFGMAHGLLTGNLETINNKIDDIQNKELWGLKVIQAQEEERKRIARDIHDGPAQELSNLVLKTEYCIRLLDKDVDKVKLELQTLKNLIRGTIDDTRRLIYDLRPMSIDDLGLIPTIKRLVNKINSENDVNISIETYYEENIAEINSFFVHKDKNFTVTIFRIIQESTNNIVKHAQAKNATIRISIKGNELFLDIQDDGKGINDISKLRVRENSGFGIPMLRERVKLVGGSLDIQAEKNKGTQIKVHIPMNI